MFFFNRRIDFFQYRILRVSGGCDSSDPDRRPFANGRWPEFAGGRGLGRWPVAVEACPFFLIFSEPKSVFG